MEIGEIDSPIDKPKESGICLRRLSIEDGEMPEDSYFPLSLERRPSTFRSAIHRAAGEIPSDRVAGTSFRSSTKLGLAPKGCGNNLRSRGYSGP